MSFGIRPYHWGMESPGDGPPPPDHPQQLIGPAYVAVAALAQKQLNAAGGGALCIYHRGRPVLDMWTGFKDPSTRARWERDTMAMSWSTTKGVASTAIHMLADRGLLDYDDLVSKYWPEYAVNGKGSTTIRHVLSMEAGLYDIRHLISDPEQMLDHATMAGLLAASAPAHRPGTKNGYHALTYGWLVGELVRRITSASLGAFVQTEIAAPLGLDGCYIGLPPHELPRVAAFAKLPPENSVARLLAKAANPLTSLTGFSLERYAAAFLPRDGHRVIPTPEFLYAEVPGANGVFTARSLAKLYATLGSDEGIDGVELWSPQTRALAVKQQNRRRDRVIALRVKWRLGYHQPIPRRKVSKRAFGFYGAFGSGAFADPDRQLAVGLTLHQSKGFPLSRLVGPIVKAVDGN